MSRLSALSILFLICATIQCRAQIPEPAFPQDDTFNASFAVPPWSEVQSQIDSIGLDNATVSAVEVAIGFERSNWAGYSILSDQFYLDIPSNASTAPAGSILKVENYTNSTLYTIPPNTALSRFLFQTENANGTVIPASAYILWPWSPRKFNGIIGYPVVSWAHGTSGQAGECAPSHIRNLWYQYSAPYVLALQGYVVVAPDYAGLGVDHDFSGKHIPHQYYVNQAAANDLVCAVQAAQRAYPQLSKEFVVMGHSQGGGAAWAAAQRQAEKPIPGYLGTIAGSPATHYLLPLAYNSLLPLIGQALSSIYPTFSLGDWLTPVGVARENLLQTLQGCQSTRLELLSSLSPSQLISPTWNSTWYFTAFMKLIQTGGRPIAEPMLVLQGTADSAVLPNTTTQAVNDTCNAYPDSQIEYAMYEGADHVPTLYASQRDWLDWIAARFSRGKVAKGCIQELHSPSLPVEAYQKEGNYFLEYALYGYEVA